MKGFGKLVDLISVIGIIHLYDKVCEVDVVHSAVSNEGEVRHVNKYPLLLRFEVKVSRGVVSCPNRSHWVVPFSSYVRNVSHSKCRIKFSWVCEDLVGHPTSNHRTLGSPSCVELIHQI